MEPAANTHHLAPSALTLTNRPSQSIVYSPYRPDGRRAVTSPPPSRCTYSIPARGGGGTKRLLLPPSPSAAAVAPDEEDDEEDDDGVCVAWEMTRGRMGVDCDSPNASVGANLVGARAKRANPTMDCGGEVGGPDVEGGGDEGGDV